MRLNSRRPAERSFRSSFVRRHEASHRHRRTGRRRLRSPRRWPRRDSGSAGDTVTPILPIGPSGIPAILGQLGPGVAGVRRTCRGRSPAPRPTSSRPSGRPARATRRARRGFRAVDDQVGGASLRADLYRTFVPGVAAVASTGRHHAPRCHRTDDPALPRRRCPDRSDVRGSSRWPACRGDPESRQVSPAVGRLVDAVLPCVMLPRSCTSPIADVDHVRDSSRQSPRRRPTS